MEVRTIQVSTISGGDRNILKTGAHDKINSGAHINHTALGLLYTIGFSAGAKLDMGPAVYPEKVAR